MRKIQLTEIVAIIAIVFFLVAFVMVIGEVAPKYEPAPVETQDGMGVLDISVKCGHNLFSKEVDIQRAGGNWIDDVMIVQLKPNGQVDLRIAPGVYEVWLIDGNGAHSEYQTVEVMAGYWTPVRFIGHAVSGKPEKEEPIITPTPTPTPTPEPTVTPTPTPTIIPCYNVTQYSEHFPATTQEVCHDETVVDVPAKYYIITYQITKDPVYGNYKILDTKDFGHDECTGSGKHKACVPDIKVKCNNPERHAQTDKHGWHLQNTECTKQYMISKEEYGWVVTTSQTEGTCQRPRELSCRPEEPKVGDTRCIDIPAQTHVEQVCKIIPLQDGYWTNWQDGICPQGPFSELIKVLTQAPTADACEQRTIEVCQV
jgi:hypothetical protein